MSDPRSGAPREGDRAELEVRRRGTVPPQAVVPPERDLVASVAVRPEHLYKAVGLLFLFALVFHYLEAIIQVALLAFAAVIAAIVLNAIVQTLPGKRGWLAGLLGIVILGVAGAVLWFGLPLLFAQVRDLAGRAPEFSALLARVEDWLQANTGLNVDLVGPRAQDFLREAFLSTGGGGGELLSRAQGVLGSLLIPLLILFGGLFAVGKPNEQLLSPLLRAVPRDRRLAFRRIFQLLGDRILGWVRGVLIGMVAVAVLSYVGYTIAGVPNSLALAVVAGLTEAIPLLGPWIGGSIAVAAGLLESPTTGLYAAVVALAVQQLENNLIVPFAMSQAAEVHPFVTLFALVLFGTLFGFLGVLLSIPLVLLIETILEVLWVERAIDTDEDAIEPVVDG